MKASGQLKTMTLLLVSILFSASTVQADNIESRVAKQQGRVGKAHANKNLSAAAVTRADNFSYKITAEEQKMKTKHHGKLTRRDKAKLNRQLNNNARTISREEKR